MKTKINYLLVFLGCMLIFPLTSNAQCSYERQAELSRIAANVQFSYTYEIENNVPIFTVHMTNLTNDLYVEDYITGTIVRQQEYSFVYNNDGKTITYNIYSNDEDCKDEQILTKNITLPAYNNLSTLEQCKNNPEFKYCQTWMDTESMSWEKFEIELDKSISKQTGKNNKKQPENTIIFINKYKMLTIFIIISLILLPFLIRFKRRL